MISVITLHWLRTHIRRVNTTRWTVRGERMDVRHRDENYRALYTFQRQEEKCVRNGLLRAVKLNCIAPLSVFGKLNHGKLNFILKLDKKVTSIGKNEMYGILAWNISIRIVAWMIVLVLSVRSWSLKHQQSWKKKAGCV